MGRGLGAILSAESKANIHLAQDTGAEEILGISLEVPIQDIVANPTQPRTFFDEESLQNLAKSIKSLGIIQPLTLRKVGEKFEIISGERRFRASKIAGLETVPAYIRLVNDKEMLEMALVENIQREDLDPIEVALTYQRLLKEIGHTQDNLSERLGKKRSTITNSIRLLNLPPEIQNDIRTGEISAGHGRAILSAKTETAALALWQEIKESGLNVRQAELLAKSIENARPQKSENHSENESSQMLKNYEEQIELKFSSKVKIDFNPKNNSGKIEIKCKDRHILEKIINILSQ